jgi:HlyD family secretion protein
VADKELADGRSDRETAENKIAKTRAEAARTRNGLVLDKERAQEDRSRAEDVAPEEEGIFSRYEIIESRVDRKLLDKKISIASQKLDKNRQLSAADVALGEIEGEKAAIKIRQAERTLKSLRVTAPYDGIVVLERSWRGEVVTVGQQVWPGQKVAEIPDLAELEARVYVLEADAAGLSVGCQARLVVEGRQGAALSGRVKRVDALAKPRGGQSPVRYFEAVLALDRPQGGSVLKLGQGVRAVIVLEELNDVLTIPRGALFEKDGRRIVFRQALGRFRPVDVTIGRLSVGRAVIQQGLAEGERVALRDPTRSLAEILKARGPGGASDGNAAAR